MTLPKKKGCFVLSFLYYYSAQVSNYPLHITNDPLA